MKTASIPSLRVDPELRRAAEDVLNEGESLSSFMEESLRASVTRRKMQQEFIARGLAAREKAQETGRYVDAKDVLASLKAALDAARKKKEDER